MTIWLREVCLLNKQYKFVDLKLSNATLITSFCAEDFRGEVKKLYSKEVFKKSRIAFEPVEDMLITSKKNVIRGLHFQRIETQSKLIRVVKGKIFAVILDIDVKSTTCGKWISLELTDDDKMVYVPPKCAFGSLALEDSIISCQCGSKFIAEYSDGILWSDKKLGIEWPLNEMKDEVILSEKDRKWQLFEEYKKYEK